jgi:asparagine synthetase B (glutamine-hydrolysing)
VQVTAKAAGGTIRRFGNRKVAGRASAEPFLQLSASGSEVAVRGLPSAWLAAERQPTPASRLGPFAEWTCAGNRLTVRNDALGIYPLYYAATGTTVAVAPSIPALIAQGVSAALDDDAVAVLLRLGFCVGDDTPFRAIRVLPPGATLTWEPGRLSLMSRRPGAPAHPLPWERAVAEFRDVFRQAVRRRLPDDGPLGLPLSGGRDSRHILFELAHLGRAPALAATARYYPPRACNDVPVAREVAAALGVPHVILDQPRSQAGTLLRHFEATNFCTLTPSHFVHVVGDFLASRASVTFDGIGGDVLAEGHYLRAEQIALFRQGRLGELAGQLLRGFQGCSEGLLTLALSPAALARFSRDRARERLVHELAQHRDNDNPMRSFLFLNRTRRDIAQMPMRCYPAVDRVECPFLDHDVVAFLMGIPDEQLLDRSFHTETIAATYPRWSGLPYVRREADHHDVSHYRRLAFELLTGWARIPSGGWLRGSSLLPRLARCLADGAYSATAAWVAPLVTWVAAVRRAGAE